MVFAEMVDQVIPTASYVNAPPPMGYPTKDASEGYPKESVPVKTTTRVVSYPPPSQAYPTTSYVSAPPPMGYPSKDSPIGYPQQSVLDQTTTKGDGFLKGW
ncbi:unnamed protein product [Lupinus luteus]|uniref:Uncharacterized protein n=1 Tax=Lupinus luteus TaxID=3873 RepID=A0AAV1WMG2_LUPLU